MPNLDAVVEGVMPFVMTTREWLHQNPATRWEEDTRLDYVARGIVPTSNKYRTVQVLPEFTGGLVVDVTFHHIRPDRDRIMLRADIDSLPITEATGLPFASQRTGLMDACGHDIHSAALLGAYHALVDGAQLRPMSNLRFVWERAEENPGTDPRPESGAEVLIGEGVLDGISAVYGLHIWNSPQTGTPGVFMSRPGGFLGNSGRLMFTVNGTGGHVAMPHGKVNALRVAHAIQSRLDTFIAHNIAPTDPAALEPTGIQAGKGLESSNIMPSAATMTYGFRTALPRHEHEWLIKQVVEQARTVAEANGALLSDIKIVGGHPALINTHDEYHWVAGTLRQQGEETEEHPIVLGGESFAHYLYRKPGAFWMLGSHGSNSGGDHHTPTFNPNPDVFHKMVKYWLVLATS